jgi:hypothetical protein
MYEEDLVRELAISDAHEIDVALGGVEIADGKRAVEIYAYEARPENRSDAGQERAAIQQDPKCV